MTKKYVLYVFGEFDSLNHAKETSNDILESYNEVDRVQIRDPLALREEFTKQLDLFLG